MAEIEIDISLLSANPTDVDSPYSNQNANVILSNPAESSVTGVTQSLITDIFAIGPSGPQGPSGAIGPQGPMGIPNTGELDLRYVNLTGDQSISGIKNFYNRPTVNEIPVMISGDGSSSVEQYVKNDEGAYLLKGQPVYVAGSNGNNILIKLARNTGESTSSKTFGLLKQDLAINQFGYTVTEGVITQIDTSMANEGDPIWLGSTGNLIFGLTNKPYAPNHLVYLGFVERKHQNQGKIFVKIQNGFELDELHNVQINHSRPLNNEDILRYNSASGIWFNQPLNTGSIQIIIENTGSVLNDKINALSGNNYLTSSTASTTYATITNLASTGNALDTKINFLSGYLNSSVSNIVFTTGDQTIGGLKTFTTGILFVLPPSGTGIFGIGPYINITGSLASGNLFTGISITIVDDSRNTNSRLLNLRAGVSGLIDRFFVPVSGTSIMNTPFNINGNVAVTGSLSTTSTITATSTMQAGGVTVTTNNRVRWNPQTDLFSENTGILSQRDGVNPQIFRIFNRTGTNTGEFGLFGWRNNQLIIGSQQTNSGILRDVILTGANININASGVLNIFDNTNIVGNLTVSGNSTITGNVTINNNLNALGNYYLKLARLTDQTITTTTDTAIQFSTINDPNNWYNPSTYRTTPTVSGNYCINTMVTWKQGSVARNNQTNIQIRRNDTTIAINQVPVESGLNFSVYASAIATLNGSSDYIDITAYTSNTTSQNIYGSADGAWTKMELFKLN